MTTGKKFSLIVGEVADNNKGAPCPPDCQCPACGLESFDTKLCCHEISEASRAPFFFFPQRKRQVHHSTSLNPPTIKPSPYTSPFLIVIC